MDTFVGFDEEQVFAAVCLDLYQLLGKIGPRCYRLRQRAGVIRKRLDL